MHKLATKCEPPTRAGTAFLSYVRKGKLPPGTVAPRQSDNSSAEWQRALEESLLATDRKMSRDDELRLRTLACQYANLVSISTPRAADDDRDVLSDLDEYQSDSGHDSHWSAERFSIHSNEDQDMYSSGSD